jgi:hypothetical protein
MAWQCRVRFVQRASNLVCNRRRLQVRRVIYMKLLNRRPIVPVRRLLAATKSSSVLISSMSRSFLATFRRKNREPVPLD